jgi:hypothetical protein
VVDNCRLLSITANLGDTKTTITHPASTTHGRIFAEARAASGIGEGLLRIAVGLESPADLQADLARGLANSSSRCGALRRDRFPARRRDPYPSRTIASVRRCRRRARCSRPRTVGVAVDQSVQP